MKNTCLPLWIALTALAMAGERPEPAATPVKTETAQPRFTLAPIGRIEREGQRTFIRLDARYQDGLLGLEQWSHLWVFYWFDRNDTPEQRSVLRVHSRGNQDNPLTGVFATRSPMRPNLIALSLCRLVSIKGCAIEIESIDAFDHTPVLDLKPYIQRLDSPQGTFCAPDWGKPEPSTRRTPSSPGKP